MSPIPGHCAGCAAIEYCRPAGWPIAVYCADAQAPAGAQAPAPAALADVADGCSGGVSWLYLRLLGRDIGCRYCCDEHDLAYAEGGSRADRALADARFRECVRESGRPVRAWIFWLAVRACGWVYWST